MEFKLKKRAIALSLSILVILSSIMFISNNKKEYELKEDKIKPKENINTIAMYKNDGGEDTPITTMPSASEYEIDTQKSYCDRDGVKQYNILTNIDNNFAFTSLQPNDKCYVWFNKKKTASEKTLDKLGKTSTPGETGGFGTTDTTEHNILYSDTDDFGTTYYFRGKVKDNWVKFGKNKSNQDIYWRIIRINGDGTIRLIYAGEGSVATTDSGYTTSGTNALIDKNTSTSYYGSRDKAEYVGFEFQTGQKHGHGNSATKSNVLTTLNTWFGNNLADEFASGNGKIDPNAGFCNDRRNSQSASTTWGSETDNGGTGSGTTTYYGAELRLRPEGNNPSNTYKSKPTFKCKEINDDYFTYTGATGIKTTTQTTVTGTKSLQYPIGLITADEITFAGGLFGQNNTDYYLNNQNGYYWTMSPYEFSGGNSYARVFYMDGNGTLDYKRVNETYGIRPVINLKADITLTGQGTSTIPYEVS